MKIDGNVLDDMDAMKKLDASDMLRRLPEFHLQFKVAQSCFSRIDLDGFEGFKPTSILICGMGGSAISGDVLLNWVGKSSPVPIHVNRSPFLPGYVGSRTLIIMVSYSGNTSETLSAMDQAIHKGAQIMAITSGGKLLEICQEKDIPSVIIPSGYPPRTALGLLFMPIALLCQHLGLFDIDNEIPLIESALKSANTRLNPSITRLDNAAKELALSLVDSVPAIYSSPSLEVIANRWKCQLNENSKMLAWYSTVPEMNHNGIVGWSGVTDTSERTVVMIRDREDDSCYSRRLDLTGEIFLKPHARRIVEVWPDGESLLARMFNHIFFADYTSLYLAFLRGVDPTPVAAIDKLKLQLA